MVSVELINCFQAGGLLHTRKPSSSRVDDHRNRWETDGTRVTCKASEISGRKWGSWSQHRCINFHKSSEGWMRRSRRAFAFHHGQHSRDRCATAERNCASEYLYLYETTVSQSSTHDGSSVTYFDHDHCESENVRFLTASPPIQDLWCRPSWGVATLG